MAKKVGDTYVNLGLKKGDFDAGLKRAKTGLREFERDTLASAKAVKAGFAALIGGSAALSVKRLTDAYGKQEKMERMLAAAMREKGIYSAQALKRNLEYATSLQRITAYGDEEIINAQRIFTAYRIEGEMLERLTKATLDLAAAKEMDLKGAADLVAKSVGSSTNALARYGIAIEGGARSSERMQSAVDNISKLYSGSAQAAADGYLGKTTQLSNAWGDLKETLGAFLAGPGGKHIDWLKDAVVGTDDYLKALQGAEIDKVKQRIREVEHTLAEIGRVEASGGVEGWMYRFLFGERGEAEALARLHELQAVLAALEAKKGGGVSILEARRGAGPAAVSAPEADPYSDKIFAQHAGRRQRDSDLDYQLWLSERERMAAESARQIARDDEMFAQHAARKREDVLLDENTAYQSWLEERGRQTETMSEAMKNAITGWGAHFSSTLNDAVWDADVSFASIAESFGRMITQMMIQKAVVEPIMGAFFPSARGNVFARGEIVPFARGGVIDQPTIFPMAKGLGLMGEAGPEAVMPLARTSSGDLGVRAEGLAGAEPRVEVNVYAPAGSEARVEERQTAGGKVIDVIIDEMMAGQVRPGSRFDRAMRGRYGLAPATTRR